MKVLMKKENGLYDISYYDKTKRETVILNDVTEDVVKTLRKYKRDEDDYRKEVKEHIVPIDKYEDENGEILDLNMKVEEDLIDSFDGRLQKMNLYKGLRTLTARQKEVIRKMYYENKSEIEVAEEMNLTKGRISQIHTEAMKKLRKFQ